MKTSLISSFKILIFIFLELIILTIELKIDKKRLLLIGVDALYIGSLNKTNSSAFQLMEREGSYIHNARTAYESLSSSGWTNVLCGMETEDTGVTNNDWWAPWLLGGKTQHISPVTGVDKPFPCIFSELKNNNPNLEIKVSWDWEWLSLNLGNISMPGSMDREDLCDPTENDDPYNDYIRCDSTMFNNTINYIREDFDFIFVYFGSVDETGHVKGFDSEEYLKSISKVNDYIESIFEELKRQNIFETTYIIIAVDHGVQPKTPWHGEWNDVNIHMPIFIKGPGVKKNYEIKSKTRNIDIPATIMKIFGYKSNDYWRSKVIDEIFIDDINSKIQPSQSEENEKLYRKFISTNNIKTKSFLNN
jgi:predicted AlkP superfamily pyrophosphatase or phosphodiesterase